jgi:hypothetical protein
LGESSREFVTGQLQIYGRAVGCVERLSRVEEGALFADKTACGPVRRPRRGAAEVSGAEAASSRPEKLGSPVEKLRFEADKLVFRAVGEFRHANLAFCGPCGEFSVSILAFFGRGGAFIGANPEFLSLVFQFLQARVELFGR